MAPMIDELFLPVALQQLLDERTNQDLVESARQGGLLSEGGSKLDYAPCYDLDLPLGLNRAVRRRACTLLEGDVVHKAATADGGHALAVQAEVADALTQSSQVESSQVEPGPVESSRVDALLPA